MAGARGCLDQGVVVDHVRRLGELDVDREPARACALDAVDHAREVAPRVRPLHLQALVRPVRVLELRERLVVDRDEHDLVRLTRRAADGEARVERPQLERLQHARRVRAESDGDRDRTDRRGDQEPDTARGPHAPRRGS